MRVVALSLFAIGLGQGALAADLGGSYLRGAVYEEAAVPDWSGFYVGGQAGYSNANFDFGNATQSMISFALRNLTAERELGISRWTTLTKRDERGGSFGGFVGYNTQWDDVVLGVEANYNYANLEASASSLGDPNQARWGTLSSGATYAADLRSAASAKLTDYMTFRARAGYAIGQFLPYATLGFAVGRADVRRTADVMYCEDAAGGRPPACAPVSVVQPSGAVKKSSAFGYGFSAGVGVDVMLFPNVFLRGEYEYVQFASFNDTKLNISTVRAALGAKF